MKRIYRFLAPWYAGGCRWVHWAFLHATLNTLLILALILVAAGVGFKAGTVVEHHRLQGGGYIPAPLPPPVQVIGGGAALPASYSLERFTVRRHNQGAAFSCVGQTISTMVEMERRKGGSVAAYSSGFIWNQLNGGNPYAGVSYTDAFNILQNEGDPRLSAVPLDGLVVNAGVYYPSSADLAAAAPNRFYTWHTIAPADVYSVKREIAAGNPIAFAAPWPYSWTQHYGTDPLPYNAGTPVYWHSVTLIAYSPYGVKLLNSFPWGDGLQEAWLSWSVLAASGGSLVVAYPSFSTIPPPPVKKAVKPFPLKAWTAYTAKHHKRVLPYGAHHHLLRVGWAFANLKGAVKWGAPKARAYDRKRHLMTWRWTRGALYVFLKYRKLPLKFHPHR